MLFIRNIIVIIFCGTFLCEIASADIPSPGYIESIEQKGQDVTIIIEEMDHSWYEVGSIYYSIVRKEYSNSCEYHFVHTNESILEGNITEKGKYCNFDEYEEGCGPDEVVDAGEEIECDDCNGDGIQECAGPCSCCYYYIEFRDECVPAGDYDYLLLIPNESAEKFQMLDLDESGPLVFPDTGTLDILDREHISVKDSGKRCTNKDNIMEEKLCSDSAESSSGSGNCSVIVHEQPQVFLLILMFLAGLLFLRKT